MVWKVTCTALNTSEEYPEQIALFVFNTLFLSAADKRYLLKYASLSYEIFAVAHLQIDRAFNRSEEYGLVRQFASSSIDLVFFFGAWKNKFTELKSKLKSS